MIRTEIHCLQDGMDDYAKRLLQAKRDLEKRMLQKEDFEKKYEAMLNWVKSEEEKLEEKPNKMLTIQAKEDYLHQLKVIQIN